MKRGLLAARRRLRRRIRASRRVAFLTASDAAAERVADLRDLLGRPSEVWPATEAQALGERLGPELDLVVREGGAGGTEILAAAARRGCTVVDLVELYAALTGRLPLPLVEGRWLERRIAAGDRPRPWRRAADAAAGGVLLLLAAPLMAAVAAATAAADGRPVLFRQTRLGWRRRPFPLVKFRTMHRGAEASGPRWADRDDPRVTPLGRRLRRHHLDELPQLWNVVRGDLGLVGPRPIRAEFARRLTDLEPLYDLRFRQPSGLTGWSQVLGPYGSTVEEHLVKLEMDLLYLAAAGLLDDLYVLWKTAAAAAGGRGL